MPRRARDATRHATSTTPCSTRCSEPPAASPADASSAGRASERRTSGSSSPTTSSSTDIAAVSTHLAALGAGPRRRALPPAPELDRGSHLHLRGVEAGRRRLPDHDHLPAARARPSSSSAPSARCSWSRRSTGASTTPPWCSELADGLPDLRHVICVGDTDDRRRASRAATCCEPTATTSRTCLAAHADDIAVLAFTSGTTGESEGRDALPRARMHAAIDDFVAHAGFGHGLTSLVMSPFGHLTGFTWGVLMPFAGLGRRRAAARRGIPSARWTSSRGTRSTFTMGATPFLSDLLDAAAATRTLRLPGHVRVRRRADPADADRAGRARRTTRAWSPVGG